MAPNASLTRAPVGFRGNVIPEAEVWNQLCEMVERALSLDVAAPLRLSEGATSRTLSIAVPRQAIQLVIAAALTRPGQYTAHPLTPQSGTLDTGGTTAMTLADLGTAASQTVVFANWAELNKDPADPSPHNLIAGDVVTGFYWMQDDQTPSRPVYVSREFGDENCSG